MRSFLTARLPIRAVSCPISSGALGSCAAVVTLQALQRQSPLARIEHEGRPALVYQSRAFRLARIEAMVGCSIQSRTLTDAASKLSGRRVQATDGPSGPKSEPWDRRYGECRSNPKNFGEH